MTLPTTRAGARALLLAAGAADAPPTDPAPEGAPAIRFAKGAAVRVKGDPHMAGQATGDIADAKVTDVYAVTFDGADKPYQWYTGDELEPDDEDEPEGAGPKSQPPGQQARAPLPAGFARSLVQASGLAPGASAAAATARATELLGLAAFVMQATGAATPAAAKGVVTARFRSAAELPGVQGTLAAKNAAEDSGKRLAVLERGVVAGVWTPGKIWVNGDKAKGPSAWASPPHKGPKGEQLGQSLEQLEADLAASAPLSFAGPAVRPATSALSPEELPAAAANGATPEQWAAARESVLTGNLPTARPKAASTTPKKR